MKRFLTIAFCCAMILSFGCRTATPPPCEPTFVTDFKPMDDLPVPTEPESKLESVSDDETDWRVWLDAIGTDSARWKAYAAELLHIIEAFNAANDEPSAPPPPI